MIASRSFSSKVPVRDSRPCISSKSQKGGVRNIVSYTQPARMLTHLRLVAVLAQERAELSARTLVARDIHFQF